MRLRNTRKAIIKPLYAAAPAAALCISGLAASATSPPAPKTATLKIVFNRDIRPILSDNCFACHGNDKSKRQADLRLDQPNRAVTPRKPEASELIKRIELADTDASSMPPAAFHKKLTPGQKALLKRWIKEGAAYQKHWAYEPPVKASIPPGANAVDYLVHRRLSEIGLQPSVPADRRTLIRRLSFDLIGLPPTAEDVHAFVADKSPNAYTKLVEKLLANPHYGERMAQGWLDVVRFADTIGYHSDNPRNIWPYRDYVINSFNNNKPFDVFTREQIAGDLLPNANQETRVGSAFNRLLLTTEEGGAQSKDYEARYLTDRVRAIGTVWLGQTTGCAQCHDHKFDPIGTRDFYTLGAYFADVQEAIIGGREPGMPVPSPEQSAELKKRADRLAEVKQQYEAPVTGPSLTRFTAWKESLKADLTDAQNWHWARPTSALATNGAVLTVQADGSILASGKNPDKTLYTVSIPASGTLSGVQVMVLPDGSLPAQGPGRAGNGNFAITEVNARAVAASGTARELKFGSAHATFEQSLVAEGNPYRKWNAASTIDGDVKGEQFGWAILPYTGKPHSLYLAFRSDEQLMPGEHLELSIKQNLGDGHNVGRFKIATTANRATAEARSPLWKFAMPVSLAATAGTQLKSAADGSIVASGPNPDKTDYTVTVDARGTLSGVQIETLPDATLPAGGPGRAGNGNFVITEVVAKAISASGGTRRIKFSSARATYEQEIIAEGNPYKKWSAASAIDDDARGPEWGWAILPNVAQDQSLYLAFEKDETLAPDEKLEITIKQQHGTGHNVGKFRIALTANRAAAEALLTVLPPDLSAAIRTGASDPSIDNKLAAYFKETSPEYADLRKQMADAQKARDDFEASIPKCLITVHSDNPRTVRILPRGNWMDETGEIVKPATPAYMPGATGGTRLDLANWIVSRQNPLTARTVMNRLWKQFFGNGLSKVLEDLGAQGEPPAKPALLDYLACEFMDSGWDVKHMVRLLVNSNVYRQTSVATPAQIQKDPYNREYARQSRFRLEAEEIRDNALTMSGLISLKIGGPSVKPYQPERYWDNLNFPVRDYIADKGESQYRRGIYTWWQRSFLHPSLLAFDAPSREECAADRNRSNIPQQALVLLNDPTYVEADRALAMRAMKECHGTPEQMVTWMWRQALQRKPSAAELAAVVSVYRQRIAEYRKSPDNAKALVTIGFTPVSPDLDICDVAAYTHAARIIMNLHETITRE
jgi:Protein of unknown function (DUF1553)/Protein of unknown function (DUF1549)/Planctomycete cytochrome C